MSVLMPVHNAAGYVSCAIDSILGQTYEDFELLIVDDGSTDMSVAIIQAYADSRVRLIRHARNMGVSAALNHGLESARGELIARQDADDLSHPQRIERQVAFLDRHPDTAALGTQARLIDQNGRRFGSIRRSLEYTSILWALLFDNPVIHTSVMYWRAIVQALGGYDPALRLAEDFDLWSRVAFESRVRNLGCFLVDFRQHAGSSTQAEEGRRQSAEENSRIIRRNLHRLLGFGLSPRSLELVLHYRMGLERHEVVPFLLVMQWLLLNFLRRTPGARASPDFWRTVGRQYVTAASGLRRSRRSY